jgi:DNA-directed RNA polymerase subunit L
MEIEFLREDSQGFELKIIGEDHTFLNLLTSFLDKNPKVEYAAYKIEHPLVGEPKLFFKIKGVSESEDISIRKVKGVGPKTADQLESVGIITASQLLLTTPEKLSERTGIAVKLLSKYMLEAKKMVPKDKFGYRAVLKEALTEVTKTLDKLKKEV